MSLFRNWFGRAAVPPPPPPPMIPALAHWPRHPRGVPCGACERTFETAERRFNIVVDDNTRARRRVRELEAWMNSEMEFMTGGTFGRDTTSRVTARIRTYERGVWAGWKGYGRRRPAGTSEENRYEMWFVEPTNTYRIQGEQGAIDLHKEIENRGLTGAVAYLLRQPNGAKPYVVTVDWMLNAAEGRAVRRRVMNGRDY